MKTKEIIAVFAMLLLLFKVNAQVKVTNLTNDFLNYYASSKDAPAELKIKNFKTEVYDRSPLIYENLYNDIKWIGQAPDNWLLKYVDEFKNIENGFRELSGKLYVQFDSSLVTFQRLFPDFKPDFDVCILHSLGIRAGGPVTIQNKTVLMFGVDQMAKYFSFQNFKPFFLHELVHIYHSQHFTPVNKDKYSNNALYNFLWREGLAVYLSSVLNPDARDVEVFMVDSLRQKTNGVMKVIARDLVDNLYSTDKKLIEKYFWMSSNDTAIPKTAGYFVGYYLVSEIAKNHSLNELVALDEKNFIPQMEEILKRQLN